MLNEEQITEQTKSFEKLLEGIESINDRKRQLWVEIYKNALQDRVNAYAMYVQLAKIVRDDSPEHAVHGQNIARYIERMSRANDQLTKLAELIAEAEKKSEDIDVSQIYKDMTDDLCQVNTI